MRPSLIGVDIRKEPPQMLVCFEDAPPRFVSIRVKTPAFSRDELYEAAKAELEAFTTDELELLSSVAQPDPAAAEPLFGVAVDRVDRVGTYAGLVFCPGCAARIGRAESPSIGYVTSCTNCRRDLEIRVRGDQVLIAVRARTSE